MKLKVILQNYVVGGLLDIMKIIRLSDIYINLSKKTR